MKAIEVNETIGQRENDQKETKENKHYPDAGGAHGSQNNNRASLDKRPLNEAERQAAREVLEQKERKQVMEEIKKSYLTEKFDSLTKPAQKRALEFAELSAEYQKLALDAVTAATAKEITNNDTTLKLPRLNDGSYQTLPPYSRMTNDELRDFVKENWGQYLKAFNSDLTTDVISRKELKAYDKRLMNRLEKLPAKELNNIIQTTSEKIKKEIGTIESPPTEKEIKKATQILNFAYRHKENQVEPV